MSTLPPSQDASSRSLVRRRMFAHTRCFLVIYYASAGLWGIRLAWPEVSSPLDTTLPSMLLLGLAGWAILDMHRRGDAMPLLAEQWFLMFAGLTVPTYISSGVEVGGAWFGWLCMTLAGC
jgi:hypothetical protein